MLPQPVHLRLQIGQIPLNALHVQLQFADVLQLARALALRRLPVGEDPPAPAAAPTAPACHDLWTSFDEDALIM